MAEDAIDVITSKEYSDSETRPTHIRRVSSSLAFANRDDGAITRSSLQLPRTPTTLSRSLTLPHRRRRSSAQDKLSLIPDATPLEPATIDKVRRWILCVVNVDFDVDEGPVVRGIYPPYRLPLSLQQNLAFLSFPDSLSSAEGSELHSFRLRGMADGRFIHGFARFSQQRDTHVKRGYSQRSLVVLSHHPWPGIFIPLIDILGPMYLRHGGPMLETACHNIASWPSPSPGATLELGVLGSVIHILLPDNTEKPLQADDYVSEEKYNPSLHLLASAPPPSPPPLALFATSISHMWSIWECLLLGEPLVIHGLTPSLTSQAIWWLLNVLRPLNFPGDFRPYITIHDKDYSSLINKNAPQYGLLLGVTNPFIIRSCTHWPHTLSLDHCQQEERNTSLQLNGYTSGWYTKTHKRYIAKDQDVLRQLQNFIKSDDPRSMHRGSALLHQHFSKRAAEFLVPLNRYLTTLMPMPTELASSSHSKEHLIERPPRKPLLKPFNHAQFLATLDTQHSPLPFRYGKEKKFYERWLKSPAFGLWLADQEEVVYNVVERQIRRREGA